MKIELIRELVNDDMIPKEYLEYIEEHGVKPSPQEDEVEEGVSTPIKFDDGGFILMPPIKPEEPDTSNWKRMTPKRVMMLTNYRMELAEYNSAKAEYDLVEVSTKSKMDSIREFLASPRRVTMDDDEIPVFEYPCGKWHRGLGTNLRRELPWDAVEHHKAVFSEVQERSWIQQLLYDKKWRMEEYERERTEYRQSRSKFRKARDTTVQLDLFSNNYRDITKDVLHTFETDPNKELGMKYVLALVDKYRPCIHGSVNIPSTYILLTPSERDEIDRRAKMIGGK